MTENKLDRLLKSISIGYESDLVEDDWFVKIIIPKQDKWQDTESLANVVKSEIQQAIDERSELKEKAEKYDKINELGDNAYSKLLEKIKQLQEHDTNVQIKNHRLVKENQQLKDDLQAKILEIDVKDELLNRVKQWQQEMEKESKNTQQEANHSLSPSAISYYLKKQILDSIPGAKN